MAWTDEQLAAMQKNSGNLLVAAGAGSGKTAVLIERIMGIITDLEQPVDVDRLLVLTYTNAAAAEMRQRLTAALRERLAALGDGGELGRHITRQLVLMQRAKIMTIHAFCLDLLREYGYALDLDAKSRVGSEAELSLLRDKTLEEVFEAAYADENSGLHLLLRHYSRGLGDDNIKALVLRLIEFGQSMPDIEQWLQGLAEVYQQRRADSWLAYFAECLQDELAELGGLVRTAAELAGAAELAAYLPLLADEAAGIARAAESLEHDLRTGLQALARVEFKRLPAIRAKDNPDPAAKERVQLLRKQVKDGVAALLAEAAPIIRDSLAADLAEQAPLAEALVGLTLDFYQAWQQAKRRRRLLEFADLEHFALSLLQNEQLGVAASLRQQFFEILVDEYQDVNEVQESLLSWLSNGNNCFMVGDIKQSIYRFRLAEPSLFLRRFAAYGRGEGGRRIDLNRNFRSQSAVLAGVNFVFAQLMRGGNLEIEYGEEAMLHCGRPELAAQPVELLIIDKAAARRLETALDKAEAGQELNGWLADIQAAELEANLLAQKLKLEHEQGRKWSDMVILLRAVRAWAPVFSQVLRGFAIPLQADGFDDFLSLPEVQVVCSLLAVLDNPRQDIALATALHSPLVGLDLAELADLHIIDKQSLYNGLCQSHDSRLVQFNQRLQEWRRRSLELGTAELLEYLYNDTALPELLGLLPGGGLRRRSLQELKRLAGEYDGAGGVGLGRFLKFLAASNNAAGRKNGADGEANDAVRLMSIHKSKGLEFPVVFAAGLGSAFNEDDFRRDILLHRSLGLGMRRVDLVGRRKYPTFGFNIIARKARWESLAEALRLLYVAMTRAEQKLYLVGTVNSAAALSKTLAALPDSGAPEAGFLAKHRSFLYWLCAALLRHPDGGLLRDLAGRGWLGGDGSLSGAEGRWRLTIIDKLANFNVALEQKQAAPGFDFDSWLGQDSPESVADGGAIAGALARRYTAAELAKLPVKWSVTAYKRLLPLPEDTAEAEAALAEQKAAEEFAEDYQARQAGRSMEWYAAYGRLVHELLQKADLAFLADSGSAAADQAYLQGLLARLGAGQEDQSVVQAAERLPQRLAEFFQQPLGRRMLAAWRRSPDEVLRERRFVAGLSLDDLSALGMDIAGGLDLPELLGQGRETVFMQGVIDLAFAEPDGWILVDYKSGANRGKSAEEVREAFGLQLAVYRWALQKACGRPVKEGYIYFTANARVVRLF